MCQILNRDMCKSLPQHSGLPAHVQYAPACVLTYVCVIERGKRAMTDDKARGGGAGVCVCVV